MTKAGATLQDERIPRFRWTVLDQAGGGEEDGADVLRGLAATPKILPPKYFYDERGSQLFERICDLDEYYPTRTEEAILAERAPAIIARAGPSELLELGSGSARKTMRLIEAMRGRAGPLRFTPIDVSAGILKDSSRAMLDAVPELEIHGLIGTYEQALAALPEREQDRRLLIFLGGTIGNLTPAEVGAFLAGVRGALLPGDHFLVGFDLQKDIALIEAAYNDAKGVTAEFNLNMLRHLNRRFDGNFELARFAHEAFYNRREHRIEMHLRSFGAQRVTLAKLGLEISLAEGETIRTEISRKFDLAEVEAAFAATGLAHAETWTDAIRWFGLAMFEAV